MAIVKKKIVSKKRKLDESSGAGKKLKKTEIRESEGKIILKKSKTKKEVTNFVSLRKYDPKIEAISTKYNIPIELVESSAINIIKLVEENPRIQNLLLEDKFPIFLQLNVIKVPKCYPKLLRIELEHSLLDTDDDVCFIVPDLKQFKNKEYEQHIEFYEDLFKQKGVQNIKKIMTLHELKSEYESFELKRGLVELYDMFLVDGRISGRVVRQLGKTFYRKRKIPTPVKMDSVDLKKSVDAALKKTCFQVHNHGDSFMIQIGHNKMCLRELVENVFVAVENLDQVFPGGITNLRSINIFAKRGSSLPIHVSLENPNNVDVPRVAIKKPKLSKLVEGELSTRLNLKVVVKPAGDIRIKKQ